MPLCYRKENDEQFHFRFYHLPFFLFVFLVPLVVNSPPAMRSMKRGGIFNLQLLLN